MSFIRFDHIPTRAAQRAFKNEVAISSESSSIARLATTITNTNLQPDALKPVCSEYNDVHISRSHIKRTLSSSFGAKLWSAITNLFKSRDQAEISRAFDSRVRSGDNIVDPGASKAEADYNKKVERFTVMQCHVNHEHCQRLTSKEQFTKSGSIMKMETVFFMDNKELDRVAYKRTLEPVPGYSSSINDGDGVYRNVPVCNTISLDDSDYD